MRRQRQGFTLIELVIVVAIFLVVTMVGFGLTRDTMPRYRAKKASTRFMGHINLCRMLAIEVNKECRILMSEYDSSPDDVEQDNKGLYYIQIGNKDLNADEFDTLPTEHINENGTWDISDGSTHYLRNVSIMEWDDISGPSSSGSNTIVFSPRGWVTNPSADFSSGYITIKFVNKVAYQDGLNDIFEVHIARTGMTRLENPLMQGPFSEGTHGTSGSSTGS
jgi:prepilin-type N-terminal cleavage/methylation domain-containing protein